MILPEILLSMMLYAIEEKKASYMVGVYFFLLRNLNIFHSFKKLDSFFSIPYDISHQEY